MSNDEPAIHIFQPHSHSDHWAVWLDPDDPGIMVGLCVGSGDTRSSALLAAEVELRQVVKRLEWMREEKTT